MDTHSSSFEKLSSLRKELKEHEYPLVTIVVPTFNSAQRIGITIESLLHQKYPHIEILVIDAGSTDRTFEMVKSFRSDKIFLCTVAEYNRYEILNKGISLAKGKYINFLFPGDFYIHNRVLSQIMEFAYLMKEPGLVYSGTLLREADVEVKTLYRPLTLELLKAGKQPTSLQASWFKTDIFAIIGKFNPALTLRGGYDLFCRFFLNGKLTFASTSRILTDYDLRSVSRGMVFAHSKETFWILLRYFGLVPSLKWLFYQNELKRYLKHLSVRLKLAIGGEKIEGKL